MPDNSTQLGSMRMLEQLNSPDYASGQLDAPEQDVNFDPFAQFSAKNEGILGSPVKKTPKPRSKAAFIGPMLKQMAKNYAAPDQPAQGFVPKLNKERMELSIPVSKDIKPSFIDATTETERQKKVANSKLDKGLAAVMKPFEILNTLGLFGAAAGSRSARQTPVNQPPASAPAPRTKQSSPEWVKYGAQALGNLLGNKQVDDANRPAPNALVKQLIAAGKNAVTRKLTGSNPPIRPGDLGIAPPRVGQTKRPWTAPYSGSLDD